MAAYKRAVAEWELADTIRSAHDQGMAWRQIGDAVGFRMRADAGTDAYVRDWPDGGGA